jgi:ubiquinone/menaquinone biosynthesis C-methylase UbiE
MKMQENKISEDNKYTKMQSNFYENAASTGDGVTVDNVVGSFEGHNMWGDYEFLFTRIKNADFRSLKVLDFGCGPGRNLVKYKDKFSQIDGVDISKNNLKNAASYLSKNNIESYNLYHCNGVDPSNIPPNSYDIVMSTVTLQHICVHEIRYNYFKEFYRVLKPGGCIAIQMGCGVPSPSTVPYHDNYYEAPGTNRSSDCAVRHPQELKNDIDSIGFQQFSYIIAPVGPGDVHPFWIYFNAQKPTTNKQQIYLKNGYH